MLSLRAAIIVFLMAWAPASLACRPKHWSAEHLARAGQTIFMAEITGHDGQTITLAAFKVLKGTAPATLRTTPSQISGPADGCMAVDNPGWKRVHAVGQQWLLIGEVDAQGRFVADAPAYVYGGQNPDSKKFEEELVALIRAQGQ
jgi:hypothetical protein